MASNAAQTKLSVEHNLSYRVDIQGQPNPGMSLIDRMSHYHVPGVSIAMIHRGKIEWTGTYGVRSLGGPRVTRDTLFNAASMTKPITAVAVLKLVREGKIQLDAPVNSYLRSWKIPDDQYTVNHPVTVRELLEHTSGIPTHQGQIVDPEKEAIPTLLQVLNGTKPSTNAPVRVETIPGSKFAYSNSGYAVLALLIRDVTGKSFAQYVQQTVLSPLHMNHSVFGDPLPHKDAAEAATGYWEDGTSGVAPAQFVEPNLAAGGLWTTASDYARFVIELQREYVGTSDLILDKNLAREMIAPAVGPSPAMRYGLGVQVGGTPPNLFFAHEGSAAFQDKFIGYLDGDGVVILTSGGDGTKLVDEIVRSVAQVYRWPDFRPIKRKVVSVSPGVYDRLVGTYSFIKVMRDGDKLVAEIPAGTRPAQLYPESQTRYFLRDFPTTLVFNIGSTGRASEVEFITTVVDLHLKRTQ